ncbi:MAG: iron ABC transporter permease [Myxococcales bacterium]|nr:iron ABC transporter permease [Myxococcales bacterium]
MKDLLLVLVVVLLVATASVFLGAPLVGAEGQFVLWQLRIPRALAGLLVGATLGLVGAAFQLLFHNPLAEPSTVGTTAGAALGALGALVFDLGGAWQLSAVTLFAFAGALAASLVVALTASSGRARVNDVLLAGIAVTLAAGAVSQAVHSIAEMPALFAAAMWGLGQLPQVGYERVLVLAPFVLGSSVVLLFRARALAALALSEDWAATQGVPVRRVRLEVLTAGSLGVAACVALCGPITFVGLLVPHLVRRLLNPPARQLLGLSWLAGAAFLVVCDGIARVLVPGRELPVGVLTAALGAPALFALVLRR